MRYVDDEKNKEYEKLVEKAVNDAVASFAIDGIIISEEERESIKQCFMKNSKILLLKRKENKHE